MTQIKTNQILTYFIATVWLINGLFFKVLNFVPRHQDIVGRILGNQHSQILAILIGFLEIIIAIWVLSDFKSKFSAIAQIIIVAMMNILELILVPDLLLWGKFNILFAFFFIIIVFFNEFYLKQKQLS